MENAQEHCPWLPEADNAIWRQPPCCQYLPTRSLAWTTPYRTTGSVQLTADMVENKLSLTAPKYKARQLHFGLRATSPNSRRKTAALDSPSALKIPLSHPHLPVSLHDSRLSCANPICRLRLGRTDNGHSCAQASLNAGFNKSTRPSRTINSVVAWHRQPHARRLCRFGVSVLSALRGGCGSVR